MGPKECGLPRYCISEIITLFRITEFKNDDYYPDYFLSMCERGRIKDNSPIVITEKTFTVQTEIEHANAFVGYCAETKNHEQYINQYDTYQYGTQFLSGLTKTNEFDYIWFPMQPNKSGPIPVYIDCRYFYYEWSNLSQRTQEQLEQWFPTLRKRNEQRYSL